MTLEKVVPKSGEISDFLESDMESMSDKALTTSKIKIETYEEGIAEFFTFSGNNKLFEQISKERYWKDCKICGLPIAAPYVYIIRKLQDANLLDKNYPLLCCNCYDDKRCYV